MINNLPIDILLYTFNFLNIKDIIIISMYNKKYNNLIKNQFNYLLKNIVKNYKVDILLYNEYVTLKHDTKALSIPNSILDIGISKKINSFLID